jgi:hypothetical protein
MEKRRRSDLLPAPSTATLPLRVLGLGLLTLAILIPSCQALFPRDGTGAPRPFTPGFVRE